MLAYLGRKAEAVALAERAVAIEALGQVNKSYDMLLLIRTYLVVGEPEKALVRSRRCRASILSDARLVRPRPYLQFAPGESAVRKDPEGELAN
jgi:hypothetical protein